MKLNKTESKVLSTLNIDAGCLDSVNRFIKGNFNEAQVSLLPILKQLGFDVPSLQLSLAKRVANHVSNGVTGYKYVMGKSKVGVYAVRGDKVSKYGDWISLTAFKVIMSMDKLPKMTEYVARAK